MFDLGSSTIDLSAILEAEPAEPTVPGLRELIEQAVEIDLSNAAGGPPPDAEEGDAAQPGAESADSAAAYDLERVFEYFRDEAAALGLADTGAQHLKLALAYREMGMVGECVKSLEMAAKSPRHRFEAASGLAQTHREQGRISEAVEWYERAAETPAPSADSGRRLLYDLGQTLNEAGEVDRALAVFLELQADAPEYRDVAAWVRRLSSTS